MLHEVQRKDMLEALPQQRNNLENLELGLV